MALQMTLSSFTFPSPQHSYFSHAMRSGSKLTCKPYCPANMEPANAMSTGGSARAHETQHFRANLRKSHPPTMFLDDLILSSGLEEFEEQEQEQAEQCSMGLPEPRSSCVEGPHGVWESNEGTISPLELPVYNPSSSQLKFTQLPVNQPRLVNFDATDGAESTLLKLDLKELDRRLQSVARAESIFRLERLLKANMLDDFFARLRGMRI